MSAISSAKDELIDPQEYEMQNGFDYNGGKIAKAYREYQATLKKNNALDRLPLPLVQSIVYTHTLYCPQLLNLSICLSDFISYVFPAAGNSPWWAT